MDCGTISLESRHLDGTRHRNLHALYGLQSSKATHEALQSGERAFVLTRSTFPGTGRHAAHWTGDNQAQWGHMRRSIAGMLAMNMFGTPLVGGDVCGFYGDTEEQLCVRWTQLGALSPFARNHNALDRAPQEPARFSQKARDTMRAALLSRYALLPYWYTLFIRAHTNGGAVLLPVMHEFPDDEVTYDLDHQFLIGPALMAAPVVNEDATSATAYLPKADWYDFYTGELLHDGAQPGTWKKMDSPLFNDPAPPGAPVLMRGGHVLPQQAPALSTKAQYGSGYAYTVALRRPVASSCIAPGCLVAAGRLLADDGISLGTVSEKLVVDQEVEVWAHYADCWQLAFHSRNVGHRKIPEAAHSLDAVKVYGSPCGDGHAVSGDLPLRSRSLVSARGEFSSVVEVYLPSGTTIGEDFSMVYTCCGAKDLLLGRPQSDWVLMAGCLAVVLVLLRVSQRGRACPRAHEL